MKAEDWMIRDVQTCRPETSMNDAAQLLWERDCGALPVVETEGKVVGMITDRDMCMAAYLQGKSLKELRVGDSMTRTVFSCQAADPIEEVIRRMSDEQVRRVPVLDARGKLVGILALNDLVRRMVTLSDERQRARLVPRLMEAMASISETRAASLPEITPVAPARGAGRPLMVG